MDKSIRVMISVILLAIGALAVSAALVARWVDRTLLDADTFVTAVEPVIRDEATLNAASESISGAILQRVSLDMLATSPGVPDALRPLISASADGFDTIVRTHIAAAVHSDRFRTLALSSLRGWHAEFRGAVVSSTTPDASSISTVTVSLAPYLDLLSEQTDNAVVAYAIALVPEEVRSSQAPVVNLGGISQTIPALRALHRSEPYLPWIAVVSLLAGIAVAPRRSIALSAAGFATAAASGTTLVVLLVIASQQGSALARRTALSAQTGDAVVSALSTPLATSLVWATTIGVALGLLGIVIAIAERARRSRTRQHAKSRRRRVDGRRPR